MPVRLLDSFVSTDPLAHVFSDDAVLAAMLQFETALARAAAHAGLIPATAASTIGEAAEAGTFDPPAIARDSWRSATLTVPLVDALRSRVGAIDTGAATYVHWGATSQDVVDTALVLCLKRAAAILEEDHSGLQRALGRLSEDHAGTMMLARTLLQPATPITFGLKAASWRAAVSRAGRRMLTSFDDAAVLQFGGSSGTLAVFGQHRGTVSARLAHELGLREPDAPWHAYRDRLAALVAACGVYCGTLGKIAHDVALLMQAEVAEASATGGRSSAMPHKRNPSGCAVALAAASRLPGLVATVLGGMAHEHERGVGGWIAEASTISAAVQATGAALAALTTVIGSLDVDAERMRTNISNTRGVIHAERAMMLLAPILGREAASRVIDDAIETARHERGSFRDALMSHADVANALTPAQVTELDSYEPSIAAAEHFRRRQLLNER